MIIGPPPKFHGTRDILDQLGDTEYLRWLRRPHSHTNPNQKDLTNP